MSSLMDKDDDSRSAESAASDIIMQPASQHSSASQRRHNVLNIHFNPSEYGLLAQYEEVDQIYSMKLSPSIVSLIQGVGERSD